MKLALVLAFVLSGAAGLIYESIWSRYLGLFVGHSAYAQILVLVIFLGGMSLGAWIAGQRTVSIRRPLMAYVLVEIAVAVLGFAFHPAFTWVTDRAYDQMAPTLAQWPALLAAARWLLAGALILPQSMLLGASFPLMSAGVIRSEPREPAQSLALLYFANSIGAAAGVLLAGFWLLRAAGLPGTLAVAAQLNISAAIAVLLVLRSEARRSARAPASSPAGHASTGDMREASPPGSWEVPPDGMRRWRRTVLPLYAAAFLTAVASFVYEIAWIRMLSLVLGSATHSFELMLSAFILGLALGALWVSRNAEALSRMSVLAVVQWAMGLLAMATLPLYMASFGWMATLLTTFQRTESGYTAFLVARYLICLAIMLPATFCAGMTLPLITRLLMGRGAGEHAIGRVYALNTFGSIIGVALAGLVLLPALGLKWLLIAGAVLDVLLGVALAVLAWREAQPRDRLTLPAFGGYAAATAAFVAAVALFVRFDRAVLTSGVYRYGSITHDSTMQVRFYRDGRTATVSVRESGVPPFRVLATNGKPDASLELSWITAGEPADTVSPEPITRDQATQVLLGLITLAHAPDARIGAVIGHGSGITSHVLLGSPDLRALATIEIEPEMIAGSRWFMPANRRVFQDPRSRFVVDDARSFFASSPHLYDLVLSEPSNPWVSGVSGLFTQEFYARVRGHLAPGGVFGQWLHLYEMTDGLALSVLAGLDANFSDYAIFLTSSADILVVASNSPLRDPDWSVVRFPAIAADLANTVPLTPPTFEAMRVARAPLLRPLLAAVSTRNSDFRPLLDLGAERARYLRERADGILGLAAGRLDLDAVLTGRPRGFGDTPVAAAPEIGYVHGLAQGARLRELRDSGWRDTLPTSDEFADHAYRLRRLETVLRADSPPGDWGQWLSDVSATEYALHLGTAGVADLRFHDAVRAYAARHGASRPARAALDFLRGVAMWDWPLVLSASETLIAEQAAGRRWVEPELLRDAVVVAHVRAGRLDAAADALRTLSDAVPDSEASRFRRALLTAYVHRLMRTRRAGEGAGT